jgi:hypothetical protein
VKTTQLLIQEVKNNNEIIINIIPIIYSEKIERKFIDKNIIQGFVVSILFNQILFFQLAYNDFV